MRRAGYSLRRASPRRTLRRFVCYLARRTPSSLPRSMDKENSIMAAPRISEPAPAARAVSCALGVLMDQLPASEVDNVAFRRVAEFDRVRSAKRNTRANRNWRGVFLPCGEEAVRAPVCLRSIGHGISAGSQACQPRAGRCLAHAADSASGQRLVDHYRARACSPSRRRHVARRRQFPWTAP